MFYVFSMGCGSPRCLFLEEFGRVGYRRVQLAASSTNLASPFLRFPKPRYLVTRAFFRYRKEGTHVAFPKKLCYLDTDESIGTRGCKIGLLRFRDITRRNDCVRATSGFKKPLFDPF